MKRWFYRLVFFGLVLYWPAIFIATHLPPGKVPAVHVSDKLQHLIAFAILTIFLDITLAHKWRSKGDWLTLLFVLMYAAIDERSQPLIGREADIVDWFADGTGAAIGLCLCGMARTIEYWWQGHPVASQTPVFGQPPIQDSSSPKAWSDILSAKE